MGDSSCACWYPFGGINGPLIHSPLPEKYLEFLDGILPQSLLGQDDMDQVSLQKTDYSETIYTPSVYIEMNHALLQSTAIPAVGIHPAPPNNIFKFKYCDSYNKSWCGYEYDIEFW